MFPCHGSHKLRWAGQANKVIRSLRLSGLQHLLQPTFLWALLQHSGGAPTRNRKHHSKSLVLRCRGRPTKNPQKQPCYNWSPCTYHVVRVHVPQQTTLADHVLPCYIYTTQATTRLICQATSISSCWRPLECRTAGSQPLRKPQAPMQRLAATCITPVGACALKPHTPASALA